MPPIKGLHASWPVGAQRLQQQGDMPWGAGGAWALRIMLGIFLRRKEDEEAWQSGTGPRKNPHAADQRDSPFLADNASRRG